MMKVLKERWVISMKKIDIIVPVYNEESNLVKFYEKTKEELKGLKYNIIFVNDGSKDNSIIELKKVYERDKDIVKIISFSRNFGKDAAMYAGLKFSKADYACIIDADLQQNPKYLVEMYNFLEGNNDYDCIAMVQKSKKRFLETSFYKFISSLSNLHFESGASDFRMFRKSVVKSLVSLGEVNRFTKGMFSYVGFNTFYKEYIVEERVSGVSKFNRLNQFKYAFDGITSFSNKPLRISTFLGAITTFVSFAFFVYLLVKCLIIGDDVSGVSSLMCALLFVSGVQLLCIGVLGEYIGKVYNEVKGRPVFIAKEVIGFDDSIL